MGQPDHSHPLRILALGVGNTLMTDEAAGPLAVQRFAAEHGAGLGVTCLDVGTLGFPLAAEIGAADALIVFDAARFHAAPGTVRALEGAEMDHFVRSGSLSVHEVGLRDLLDMARLTGDLPGLRALIGIEPGEIGWGLAPSAPVAEALPRAVAEAARIVRRWRTDHAARADAAAEEAAEDALIAAAGDLA